MDAFRSLSQGVLPPAGNRIALTPRPDPGVAGLFPGRSLHWVDSGTSALALALLDIRQRAPELDAPEVLIPAYCCPDLISAALFAGFTPVLVDLAPESCHPDVSLLREHVTERTLAVIAINFLGLPAPLTEIRATLGEQSRVAIISDCAQWFPSEEISGHTDADYLTFSFGRGKAVNLLGGGLLVAPVQATQVCDPMLDDRVKTGVYLAKCAAYNVLLHPLFYQLLARNPLLKLGETRYHRLERLTDMPPWQIRRVRKNVDVYKGHKRAAEHKLRLALDEVNTLAPLLQSSPERLLRYPLLVRSEAQRNAILADLQSAGLGATALYGQALPAVADVPVDALRYDQTKHAQQFAQRLITLPVHEGVSDEHYTQIVQRVLHHC